MDFMNTTVTLNTGISSTVATPSNYILTGNSGPVTWNPGPNKEVASLFKDQQLFMEACDQSTGVYDEAQYAMYRSLIEEEVQELRDAIVAVDKVEQLDALLDIMVVTIGAMHSLGVDGEAAWDEVMRTNFAKIDPTTGKVTKRADGKVIKPVDWQAPELAQFINEIP